MGKETRTHKSERLHHAPILGESVARRAARTYLDSQVELKSGGLTDVFGAVVLSHFMAPFWAGGLSGSAGFVFRSLLPPFLPTIGRRARVHGFSSSLL